MADGYMTVLAKTISIWFVFHQAVNSKKQEMLYIWNSMHSIQLSFSLALLSMPVALLACRFRSSLDGLKHSLDVSTLDHDIPQLVGQQWCPIYYSMNPDSSTNHRYCAIYIEPNPTNERGSIFIFAALKIKK